MSQHTEELVLAFPSALSAPARTVIRRLPRPSIAPSSDTIGPTSLDGDDLQIPTRIYNPPLPGLLSIGLSDTERRILHCLYSRHHDGFVRQRHLERLLPVTAAWQVPFVVRLVSEYVVEIVEVVEPTLSASSQPFYVSFVRSNPDFIARARQRAISYWNCYYRHRWPTLDQYPALRIFERLLEWAAPDR